MSSSAIPQPHLFYFKILHTAHDLPPQKGSLRFTEKYTEVCHMLLTPHKHSPSHYKQARTDKPTDASLHHKPVLTLGITLGVHIPQGLMNV